MNLRFTVAYEGTHYSGWQRQGNTGNTVQAKLTEIFSRYFQTKVDIQASGRTDAGVHAAGQVCHVQLPEADPQALDRYLRELNGYLPADIRLLEFQEAATRFHSRLHAVSKTYRYVIYSGVQDPFERRHALFLDEALNVEAMRQAAQYLLGEHDFLGFSSVKPGKRSTVRTLTECSIIETWPYPQQQKLVLDWTGSGFLYHMVRYLTGTLIEVGQGRREPESVNDILASKDKDNATFLAPAAGLTLWQVDY